MNTFEYPSHVTKAMCISRQGKSTTPGSTRITKSSLTGSPRMLLGVKYIQPMRFGYKEDFCV